MVGWRQRAARSAQGPEASSRSRSPLRGQLPPILLRWLQEWAWGGKSAASVAEDAYALIQGRRPQDVHRHVGRLARARGHGQNAQLVLMDALPMSGIFDPIQVPESSVQWVLPPEAVLDWVQDHHPRRFKMHFGATDNGIQDFWDGLMSTPSGRLLWEQHPWLRGRTPEDLDHHLPVCLFDDAGPVSNSQSSYVRQWYSILGKGADRETHILLSTGLTNTQLPDQSWPVIMQSFENLARPKAAGRWGAVVLFLQETSIMCAMS